jgi:hypothetical protein
MTGESERIADTKKPHGGGHQGEKKPAEAG